MQIDELTWVKRFGALCAYLSAAGKTQLKTEPKGAR